MLYTEFLLISNPLISNTNIESSERRWKIPGSVFGSSAGNQTYSGRAIVQIEPGEFITSKNHTSATNVT